MIRRAFSVALLFCAFVAHAQDDPTIMTINGRPVSRSEFEYSYNKNNTDNVVDKKTVAQYVELFVNYKLKVEAALAARLDTTQAFRNEFADYRDQQVRPGTVEAMTEPDRDHPSPTRISRAAATMRRSLG